MKSISYVRVSTTDQAYGLQTEAIRKAAEADGLQIAATYEDTASGWRNVRRPGLDKLLADADSGKLRGVTVYVYALSRISRKGTRDTLQTLDRLALGGVSVKSVTESYINTTDTNPFRDVILALFATVAKLESQTRSDRMKSWADYKRTKGEKMGRDPIKIDPERLRSMRAGGVSIGQCARSLSVARNTVKKALRNLPKENDQNQAG